MNCNTKLITAVCIALGGTSVAMAAPEECATKATQLKVQVEAASLADSDRAKLESSLSEAQSADVTRCQQIVDRISRDLSAGSKTGIVNPDTGSEYSSHAGTGSSSTPATQGDQTSSTTPEAITPDYERGQLPATQTLPRRQANSPDETSATTQDQEPTAQPSMSGDETSSNDTSATDAPSSDAEVVALAGGARMSSATDEEKPDAATSSALASMTSSQIVNKPVKAANGKKVGDIDAVVIDRTPKGHGYVVVGVGGIFGLGEKKVVVDLDKLELTADGSIAAPVTDERELKGYTLYSEAHYQKYQGDLSRLM